MSTIIFTAKEGNARGLWRTDGTTDGTIMIRNFGSLSALDGFTDLGNGRMAFIAANSSGSTRQLWITDGTSDGTFLLKAGVTFGSSSGNKDPQLTAIGNGKLLFLADDGSHGSEAWVSDGSVAGTHLLADLRPGSGSSLAGGFVSLGNGKGIFSAAPKSFATFVTDGTEGGTVEIAAKASPSRDADSAVLGSGKAVFASDDSAHGLEPWVSDGTAAGTMMLADLVGGTDSSVPSGFLALGNGKAVFHTSTAVYVTDGTVGGTVALASFAGIDYGPLFTPLGNGTVVFRAFDVQHGSEVWVTDGTKPGTRLVKDLVTTLNSNKNGTLGSNPANFHKIGQGLAAFTADDNDGISSIYVTDGTAGGTVKIGPVEKAGFNNGASAIQLKSGNVLFTGVDDDVKSGTGAELWVTDGPNTAGHLLVDIAKNGDSGPRGFTLLPGGTAAVFAAGDNTNGAELWISDGTLSGTRLIKDINTGLSSSNPENFHVLTDTLPSTSPTDISLSASVASEFAKTGTTVGTLSATDADTGDTFSFALLDNAGGRFVISGDSLKVANGLLLDYEQARSDTVTVQVTDAQGHSFIETLTLTTKDVNPETVTGSSRADSFVGGAKADMLSGAAGSDRLTGGAGNDTLDGGLGKDLLKGDAGKDTFFFSVKPSAANLDHIKDFRAVDDTIKLENAIFKAIKAGHLHADEFALIKTSKDVVDSDAHILYDKAHGALYYDPNGGSASGRIEFAVLDNHTTLTFQDFLVV